MNRKHIPPQVVSLTITGIYDKLENNKIQLNSTFTYTEIILGILSDMSENPCKNIYNTYFILMRNK